MNCVCVYVCVYYFLKDFIYIQRGREGERKCVVASYAPPTEDLTHKPGMCHDWELNW